MERNNGGSQVSPTIRRPPNDDLFEIARVKASGLRSLRMDNSKHFRTCWALQEAIDALMSRTPIEKVAHVILTTTECQAKKANKHLGRIAEFLRRSGIKFIRFLDRLDGGEVHWHLLAALPFAVVENYICGQSTCTILYHMDPWKWEKAVDSELTDQARALLGKLASKLRKCGYGGIAKIQPIVFPDRIGNYLCKWVKGSASRFRGDKRGRLFSASKEFRVPTTGFHFLTSWFRIARVKMAAYCQLNGWTSFAEASAADARWQFNSREFLEKKIPGLYVNEEDFAEDCGIEFSPHLLGVSILNANADLRLPPVPYLNSTTPCSPELVARLQERRRRILPLSREQWLKGGQG